MNQKSIILLITTLVILIAGVLAFYFFAPVYIAYKLKDEVDRQSQGLYTLNIENFRINIFTGNTRADAVRLIPDTVRISGKENQQVLFIETKRVILKKTGLWKLLVHQAFDLDEIRINDPEIDIVEFSHADTDSTAHFPEIIFERIKSLSIDLLNIDGCGLRYKIQGDTVPVFEIQDMVLTASGLTASLTGIKEDPGSYDFETLKMETGKIISRQGGKYEFSANSFQANSVTARAKLDSLCLQPLYGKLEYGKIAGYQVNWVSVQNTAIHFENIDLKALVFNKAFHVGKVSVDPVKVEVFRDKRLPVAGNDPQPMPQEQLLSLPFSVAIDSLLIINSYVEYEEIPGDKIWFSQLNLNVSEISNNPEDTVRISGKALLMGKGSLKAELVFPLADPVFTFTYHGSLGEMPISDVNNLLEGYLGMRASSGVAEQLFFNIRADKNTARGEMEFYYHDFKVELISHDPEKENKIQRKLGAMLLNRLVIKQSNPDRKGRLRTAHVQYDREKEQYIFNYLWKSLLYGLKQSTGLYINNGKLEKRVMKGEKS